MVAVFVKHKRSSKKCWDAGKNVFLTNLLVQSVSFPALWFLELPSLADVLCRLAASAIIYSIEYCKIVPYFVFRIPFKIIVQLTHESNVTIKVQ